MRYQQFARTAHDRAQKTVSNQNPRVRRLRQADIPCHQLARALGLYKSNRKMIQPHTDDTGECSGAASAADLFSAKASLMVALARTKTAGTLLYSVCVRRASLQHEACFRRINGGVSLRWVDGWRCKFLPLHYSRSPNPTVKWKCKSEKQCSCSKNPLRSQRI